MYIYAGGIVLILLAAVSIITLTTNLRSPSPSQNGGQSYASREKNDQSTGGDAKLASTNSNNKSGSNNTSPTVKESSSGESGALPIVREAKTPSMGGVVAGAPMPTQSNTSAVSQPIPQPSVQPSTTAPASQPTTVVVQPAAPTTTESSPGLVGGLLQPVLNTVDALL